MADARSGVVGTGIDVCYPKENKKLFEKVLQRGAIVSAFPIGSHPAPENFPVRNRISAGMPIGVIIVEGKRYCGSLITARLAMEFGREVFGVPGNVTQDVSFAPNLLIKQDGQFQSCTAHRSNSRSLNHLRCFSCCTILLQVRYIRYN